jgi:hypothetical protein
MYSLDLEEFFWALGIGEEPIDSLRQYFDDRATVPRAMHNKMLELFKEFIVVGGMPAVVDSFVKQSDFSEVVRLQRGIVEGYKDDIIKYAQGAEKNKARACFLSIPKQLAKEHKKFLSCQKAASSCIPLSTAPVWRWIFS